MTNRTCKMAWMSLCAKITHLNYVKLEGDCSIPKIEWKCRETKGTGVRGPVDKQKIDIDNSDISGNPIYFKKDRSYFRLVLSGTWYV